MLQNVWLSAGLQHFFYLLFNRLVIVTGSVIRYLPSLQIQCVQLAAECKHSDSGLNRNQAVYILQIAVHTVQYNWICCLGDTLYPMILK